jgi:transposase
LELIRFKHEAADRVGDSRMILSSKRSAESVSAVARELDLVPSALGWWVKQAQADRSKGRSGLTTAEREELVRLRKALRIAEEERDILKKATAFFAKQSR